MKDERKYFVVCKYPFGTTKYVKMSDPNETKFNSMDLENENIGCKITGYELAEKVRWIMIDGIKKVHGEGYRPRFFLVKAEH